MSCANPWTTVEGDPAGPLKLFQWTSEEKGAVGRGRPGFQPGQQALTVPAATCAGADSDSYPATCMGGSGRRFLGANCFQGWTEPSGAWAWDGPALFTEGMWGASLGISACFQPVSR